ncbi:TonB-dependent receptor [Sphingomonas sp. LHG3406-1]|uniref:TonB-dependent receptor domain-containing protein n=1 Tax=Sphingomonas sp. LHG3406-1 TaxID=2804617 RepID=UPI00261C193D|nr:TonB-dependent receptor [Sphingomonas sp. LHG3406-1]
MKSTFLAAAASASLAAGLLAAAPASAQQAPAASAPPARPQAGTPPQERDNANGSITVTGSRPQVIDAPDRLSFNVASDLGAQTGSLADALRNVPGVEVDLQGNVSLRGDSGVTILVDGRPSGQLRGEGRGDALLSMPANNIERVEVITNPSAAMSPEGSGGVINLVTRKQRAAGTSGSVRANIGLEERGNVSLSLARNRPGTNITGEVGYRRFTNEIDVEQERTRFLPLGGALESRQDSRFENVAQSFNARVGLEHDLDKTNRLTADVSFRRGDITSEREEAYVGNAVEPGFLRVSEQDMNQKILSLRTGWRKTLPGKDHSLSLDLEHDVGGMKRSIEGRFSGASVPTTYERIVNDIDRNDSRVKLDYKKPLGEGRSLNLGYEYEQQNADAESVGRSGASLSSLAILPGLTSAFDYRQDVHAWFATAQVNSGKWEFQPGLRLEQVDLSIDPKNGAGAFEQEYFRVYPTLHIGRALDDRTKLRASYSRRISRPGPLDLNPFVFTIDPRNIRSGNPNLKPEITDAFELSAQYRKDATFISLTSFYRRSKDGFTDISEVLGDGTLLTTRANLGKGERLGIDAILNGRITKKLTYNLSGTLQRWTLDADGSRDLFEEVSDVVGSARGSLTWQPTAKDYLQLSGNWPGKQLLAQGYRKLGPVVNLGYRRKIDDQLSLLLTGQDILGTARQKVVIRTPTVRDELDFKVGARAFFVGLAYNFGGNGRRRQDERFDFDPSATSVGQ